MQLEAKDISKSYGSSTILNNVSLHVDASEFLVIVGRSGTGKSTLLRILATLEQQDAGAVLLEGKELPKPKKKLVPGHEDIQLAHQGFELHPHMSARENIERGLLAYQADYRAHRTNQLLDLADLQHATEAKPRQLSGGQQQKLSIATALASEPKVLLLDEPFSNLDPFSRDRFLHEIKITAAELGTAVILVTHDTREALAVADRIMVLQNGEISQEGTPEEIYHQPNTRSVAEFFGRVNYFSTEQAAEFWPELSLGSSSWVGFRPASFQLSGEGVLRGTVYGHSFQGAYYVVHLERRDGLKFDILSTEAIETGRDLRCTANLARAMFFD